MDNPYPRQTRKCEHIPIDENNWKKVDNKYKNLIWETIQVINTKEKKKGLLLTEGSNDVLTMALGTPEHSRKVRGVGAYVTPKTYFSKPTKSMREILLEHQQWMLNRDKR
ncbi:hypothetical protein L484_010056 [Morus notabilis]|uniref:Uncharacterized protein n=1 Tax=Morus notabilis TaxID=981085 RepID=W9RMK5_9ROSA|nr:hypothetical protein L484_010056 [Morus notabilis]